MLKPSPPTTGLKRAGGSALSQPRPLHVSPAPLTCSWFQNLMPKGRSWALAATPPDVKVAEVSLEVSEASDSPDASLLVMNLEEAVLPENSIGEQQQQLEEGSNWEALGGSAVGSMAAGSSAVVVDVVEAAVVAALGAEAAAPATPSVELPSSSTSTSTFSDAPPEAAAEVPAPSTAAAAITEGALPSVESPSPSVPGPVPQPASEGAATAAAEPAPRAPRRAPAVPLPLSERVFRRGPGALLWSGPPAASRPFPPPLDLQRVSDALLGEPAIGPMFDALFRLSRREGAAGASSGTTRSADGGVDVEGGPPPAAGAAISSSSGGPLLYKPVFERPPGSPDPSSLPLLVYLPGMDGTGLAAYRQFPGLSAWFDLRGVFLPPDDRTPFEGLVEAVAKQLEEEATGLDPSRPVYLLGESFGGLMALALAQRLNFVDRLVLVNPATSFLRSPWPAVGPLLPTLPPEVYRLLPVALSPILANPVSMAAWATSPSDPPQQQLVDLMYSLLDMLPELSSLRTVLPPDTLRWRLELLRQGAEQVNPTIPNVRQRVLLLCGDQDLVIPSASEGPRLERLLPRCCLRRVPGGSHAMLQQSDTDLMGMMQEEDFYVSRRRLTRSNVPPSSAASKPLDKPAPGGANFGTAGPLELPTPGEIHRAAQRGNLATLRRLVSPVFLSTQPGSGRVVLGLDGLPAPGSGPVLFVGNHQLYAPDMPLMVAHFLEQRGQLLRGLAHPTALGMMQQPGGGRQIRPADDSAGRGTFGRFLETFGAVPVSGRNLHQLLAGGEAALLYPGGVREALKLRDEKYALIWPRRAEFVRMACKFGATIIPFAAVGAEDSVTLLADRRDLMSAPLLGDWLRQQDDQMVLARRGVTMSEDVEESFIPPLISPNAPSRFYFMFGEPITTDPREAADKAATLQLYGRVRSGVEGCLGYLLRKRDQDPYKDLVPRLLYEASWGGRRQAPTFTP